MPSPHCTGTPISRLRSMRMVRAPAAAAARAALLPPGPPPTTSTSHSIDTVHHTRLIRLLTCDYHGSSRSVLSGPFVRSFNGRCFPVRAVRINSFGTPGSYSGAIKKKCPREHRWGEKAESWRSGGCRFVCAILIQGVIISRNSTRLKSASNVAICVMP
jgi:hypothetical protein